MSNVIDFWEYKRERLRHTAGNGTVGVRRRRTSRAGKHGNSASIGDLSKQLLELLRE